MTIGEGMAFGGLVIGFLGFIYKVSNDETGKRKRIYERIDEIKKNNEEKLQSKEICNLHIDTINATLLEIKTDVKTLLKSNKHN